MEWVRWQESPWGQDVLLGLSWDWLWVAIAAGVLFMVAHTLVYLWRWRSKKAQAAAVPETLRGRVPDRVMRHTAPSRAFHWVMAISVLVLLFTAFLPIAGLKFPWVMAHWIAGLVLTAAIVFHVVHATMRGLGRMWISWEDIRTLLGTMRQIVSPSAPDPAKPGKNPVENKLFHHTVAVATFAAIITGLIMMAKVDTPWWNRNPYLLGDWTWGVIYVIHGVGSVLLVALVLVHVYFALRPEKMWITLSMFRGWIPRERYLEHYDPGRWTIGPDGGEQSLDAVAPQGGSGISDKGGA